MSALLGNDACPRLHKQQSPFRICHYYALPQDYNIKALDTHKSIRKSGAGSH